jgi:hypothetical protein
MEEVKGDLVCLVGIFWITIDWTIFVKVQKTISAAITAERYCRVRFRVDRGYASQFSDSKGKRGKCDPNTLFCGLWFSSTGRKC